MTENFVHIINTTFQLHQNPQYHKPEVSISLTALKDSTC